MSSFLADPVLMETVIPRNYTGNTISGECQGFPQDYLVRSGARLARRAFAGVAVRVVGTVSRTTERLGLGVARRAD